jgi:hypothetical protein
MSDYKDQEKKSIELINEQIQKLDEKKDNGELTDGQYYFSCKALKDFYDRYQHNPELDKLDKNIKNIHFLMYVLCGFPSVSSEDYETSIRLITETQKLDYWSNYFAFKYRRLYQNENFKDVIVKQSKGDYQHPERIRFMDILRNWEKSNYYYGYH